MRCFHVLIHGKLNWLVEQLPQSDASEADRPAGFYCHRFVLASAEGAAIEKAFRQVRDNLERQTGWIGDRLATLDLEATEVATAPIYNALRPDNPGHTFYDKG